MRKHIKLQVITEALKTCDDPTIRQALEEEVDELVSEITKEK